MSNELREEEIEARCLLEAKGFIVTRLIENPNGKTCDFLVADETHKYLVEVKCREEDAAFYEELYGCDPPDTYLDQS